MRSKQDYLAVLPMKGFESCFLLVVLFYRSIQFTEANNIRISLTSDNFEDTKPNHAITYIRFKLILSWINIFIYLGKQVLLYIMYTQIWVHPYFLSLTQTCYCYFTFEFFILFKSLKETFSYYCIHP